MTEKKSKNPLISVIIPIYKVEAYLHQCVDSVLKQTYTDYEIILIDDGSPDSCPRICDDYVKNDCRIKVIHKENGGLSDARNCGIHQASGEYLIFLDSDDYLFSNTCLELLCNEIKKNYFTLYYLNKIITNKNEVQIYAENITESRNSFLKKIMKNKYSLLTAWSFVCKREFIIDNNLFFLKGILHEDEEWFPRVLLSIQKEQQICVINHPFYYYRTNREGAITSIIKNENIVSKLQIIEEFFELSKTKKSIEKKFLQTRVAQIITGIIFQVKKGDVDCDVIYKVKSEEEYLLKSARIKHIFIYFLRKIGVI